MSDLKLEYVVCEICHKDFTQHVYTERGFDIVRCINCGLVYVNPRLSEEEYKKKVNVTYEELAKENLKLQGCQEIIAKPRMIKTLYIKSKFKQACKDLKSIEKIEAGKGQLLDIGCGEGFFLKTAIDGDWQARGLEISKNHRPPLEYGLDVTNEDILTAELPEYYFNVVTMWDVLEHLPHPDMAIKKITMILKKNGLLVIRVPNEKYLMLKKNLVSSIFGKDFYLRNENFGILGFFAPETHFYNFAENTLKKLLSKHNFKVVKIKLEKPTLGMAELRNFIHWVLYYLAKLIYFVSARKINYGCSLVVYAKKI